jgi:antitoxin VapB
MNPIEPKLNSLNTLLAQHQLDALLLQRVSSFAWATNGAASYVNTAATDGAAKLLITPAGRYIITNNIEAPRLEKEEQLADQGWEMKVSPWHGGDDLVARLTAGLKLGADGPAPGAKNLAADIARLRANLTPAEGDRFRELGRLCARGMDDTVRAIEPGQTEFELAGHLAHAVQSRGAQPIVNLVATDERIFKFRHPLPTAKKLGSYAMLVLCGRKWGLVCSITRLIHFGPLPDEIRRKAEAVARIDATFIAATRPGRTLGQIFEQATAAYAQTGFADEWQLHHQGGPAGYEPREYVAAPGSGDIVKTGQVYAWNPSIAGVKSEDTILVTKSGNENLTAIPDWPTVRVSIDDASIERPAILEIL